MHFLLRLIDPHVVTMFVLALICFFGYGYLEYQGRAEHGFLWLIWLVGGILSIVAWFALLFS
jgi:phosphotransferase system  glucose/maltose/N-acetylglucosamine-specific IIC component